MVTSHYQLNTTGRDRLVVRTLRCGRSNPGSNPGHGIFFLQRRGDVRMSTEGYFQKAGVSVINLTYDTIKKKEKKLCVGRESNPDQLLGRQLC